MICKSAYIPVDSDKIDRVCPKCAVTTEEVHTVGGLRRLIRVDVSGATAAKQLEALLQVKRALMQACA